MLPHNSWKVHISRTALTQMQERFPQHVPAAFGWAMPATTSIISRTRCGTFLGLLFYGNRAYAPEMREQSRYDLDAWIEFMADRIGGTLVARRDGRARGPLGAAFFEHLPPADRRVAGRVFHPPENPTRLPIARHDLDEHSSKSAAPWVMKIRTTSPASSAK